MVNSVGLINSLFKLNCCLSVVSDLCVFVWVFGLVLAYCGCFMFGLFCAVFLAEFVLLVVWVLMIAVFINSVGIMLLLMVELTRLLYCV